MNFIGYVLRSFVNGKGIAVYQKDLDTESFVVVAENVLTNQQSEERLHFNSRDELDKFLDEMYTLEGDTNSYLAYDKFLTRLSFAAFCM